MKNFSLNTKFLTVLSIFVSAAIMISVVGVMKMNELNNALNSIVQDIVPRVVSAKDLEALTNGLRNKQKVLLLVKEGKERQRVGQEILEIEGKIDEKMSFLQKSIVLAEGKRNLEEAEGLLKSLRQQGQNAQEMVLADKNEEALALNIGPMLEQFKKYDNLMVEIANRNTKILADESKRTDELYESSRNLIIAVSLCSILLGMTLATFVLRGVNKAIDAVIAGLNDSANQVTSAAQQIASSSEELSQGATEQASSLEETSSAVEEMNSMVQKNAESARGSSSISQTSGESANRGKRVVENMKKAMVEIDQANSNIMQQTTDSNQKISEIVKVIAEIGNKTKVINDIVFQTKLLSFNASVEAARAGEHGKGFAVVAEEVGNLAQMSGNAAKEISNLLDSSISKVEGIVLETKSSVEKLIADSKAKVELGSKVASDCGDVLEEIVKNVSQVTQMSQSISSASDEQARGIAEITKAVTQLDQMTQQNAAASEETASAAEELSAQAEAMQAVVQTLILTIKGGEGGATGENQKTQPSFVNRSSTRGNSGVLHLGSTRKKPQKQAAPMGSGLKMVAGSDVVPSEDDPRFKDL